MAGIGDRFRHYASMARRAERSCKRLVSSAQLKTPYLLSLFSLSRVPGFDRTVTLGELEDA